MNKEQAIGHYRQKVVVVMGVFCKYGMQNNIPKAVEALVDLSLQLHEVLNGKDIPIVLDEKDFLPDD